MCGILGIVKFDDQEVSENSFVHALSLQKHRGPDALNVKKLSPGLFLGHARLSIIDLDDRSSQPMESERYVLVYNGEIYNYLELRKELESLGHIFRTTSDTEVILECFEEWGDEAIARFNGMWAFCVYDKRDGRVLLSRDRFGIKPLYYAYNSEYLVFGSEIKSLLAIDSRLKEPDYNTIANYCRTSLGGQSLDTWFAGIKRLSPATNMTLENEQIKTSRYWNYPTAKYTQPYETAVTRYKELFVDSIRLRLRSDVPVGITLSGGLDSSSIACVSKKIAKTPLQCFTSGFSGKNTVSSTVYTESSRSLDESELAAELASELGFSCTKIVTSYSDLQQRLRKVVRHTENGNSSPAVVPLLQLMEEAKKEVTVVLEGQGADELLAGYNMNVVVLAIIDDIMSFRIAAAYRTFKKFRSTNRFRYAILMFLRHLSNDLPFISRVRQKITGLDKIYGKNLKAYRFEKDFPDQISQNESLVNKQLKREHTGGLVNLLQYGDAISMAASIESRLPFMDYRLVEFAFSLPSHFKFHEGVTKRIHRDAMRGLVPSVILDNSLKLGYSTPISEIVASDDGDIEGILLSKRCSKRENFDAKYLELVIREHKGKKKDHGPLLYRLMTVELWFREFIDDQAVN